jgi:hypothetical protein
LRCSHLTPFIHLGLFWEDLLTLNSYALNPSVSSTVLSIGLCTPDLIELVLSGLCQINCDALWEGYYVCVGR